MCNVQLTLNIVFSDLPYKVMYGTLNQRDIKSKYAGSQCTSMSIAALAYFALNGEYSSKAITEIIHEGHRLHVLLRFVLIWINFSYYLVEMFTLMRICIAYKTNDYMSKVNVTFKKR